MSIHLQLPRLHPAQLTIKAQAKRFNVVRCGRRFGKDILGNDALIHPALQGLPVAWFAPTYKMLLDNWRQARNLLQPVTAQVSEQNHRLDLITGGVIDMWSLDNHDAARGRKYKLIIINEAAMVKNLQEAWEMVLRPTLADYEGAAYFTSTPRGLNYFYTLDQQAGEDWGHFHFTTYDNPYIKRAEIDALKVMLPDHTFKQEVLAEYVEDGAYFQGISECAIVEEPDSVEQHAGHTLLMGIDWGKSNDWTVITVGCRQCNRVVDWMRVNQIDYHYQRSRLMELVNKWKPLGVLAERNSIGEPNIEELMRLNVPMLDGPDNRPGFNTSATTKADLIENLHMAFVRDKFNVPRDYAGELLAYEIAIMAGAPRFSAPSGQHDDRVMSLALCWRAMTSASEAIIGW